MSIATASFAIILLVYITLITACLLELPFVLHIVDDTDRSLSGENKRLLIPNNIVIYPKNNKLHHRLQHPFTSRSSFLYCV